MKRCLMFDRLYLLDPRIYLGKLLYTPIDNRIEKSLDIEDKNEFISYRWFNSVKDEKRGFEIENEAANTASQKYTYFGEAKELFAWYYSTKYFFLIIKEKLGISS